MRSIRRFENDLKNVTVARRYIADLTAAFPPRPAFEIELMVSELATNCVRHTGSGFTVTVDIQPDEVRVEVTDVDPALPEVQLPAPSQPTGRGLHIVDGLADEWGIRTELDGHGKTVWFTYRLEPESVDWR